MFVLGYGTSNCIVLKRLSMLFLRGLACQELIGPSLELSAGSLHPSLDCL
jgi:hypothetical protein